MFDGARDILPWAEETVTLFIGWRPVSGVPIRVVSSTEKPGHCNRFINLKAVSLACSPQGVGAEEAHKAWLEVEK